MALKAVDPVRKISGGQRGGSHMMLRRIGMELSNGVESQNTEFKPDWRDGYLKVISAFANMKIAIYSMLQEEARIRNMSL